MKSTLRATASKKRALPTERETLPETVSLWETFYRVIRRIPAGRVCTYGAIAAMAGFPRYSRHVGFALNALRESTNKRGVPWQRVLGSAGREKAKVKIKDAIGGSVQRALLEAEGVAFDSHGNVSLSTFGWFAKPKKAPAKEPAVKKTAAKKRVAKRPSKW